MSCTNIKKPQIFKVYVYSFFLYGPLQFVIIPYIFFFKLRSLRISRWAVSQSNFSWRKVPAKSPLLTTSVARGEDFAGTLRRLQRRRVYLQSQFFWDGGSRAASPTSCFVGLMLVTKLALILEIVAKSLNFLTASK